MDYPLVIGILVVLVVGFFAFQWMTKRPRSPMKVPVPVPVAHTASDIAPPAKEEKFPVIAGQTATEALTKEPDQRREPSSSQAPAMYTGEAPAQFEQHLRHPEQLFHQPEPAANSDVASGRASDTVQAGGQGFSPEMAQNGGAFLGNSVFAYDGMEPTGFTAF